MNWCFVYMNYVTGGLETYVLRMCKYLCKNGDSVYLATMSVSEKMRNQFEEAGAKIVYFDKWNRNAILSRMNHIVDVFISFWLSDYILLKRGVGKSILYCVHPNHLTMVGRKHTLIEDIKESFFSKVIKSGVEDNSLFVMDENIVEEVYIKYKIKVPPEQVLPLPYVPTVHIKQWKNNCTDSLHVLTILRADFPFKSYVLGLIDAIDELTASGYNLKLTVVSYGNDVDKIERRIFGKKYIRLIGETPYDELTKLYCNSDIYVGMGSTAFEAANYGLPVILANVNSPTFLSCGYFHENPTAIGEFNSSGYSGIDLLKNLADNYDKLYLIGNKSRESFLNTYSIQKYVDRMKSVVLEKQ